MPPIDDDIVVPQTPDDLIRPRPEWSAIIVPRSDNEDTIVVPRTPDHLIRPRPEKDTIIVPQQDGPPPSDPRDEDPETVPHDDDPKKVNQARTSLVRLIAYMCRQPLWMHMAIALTATAVQVTMAGDDAVGPSDGFSEVPGGAAGGAAGATGGSIGVMVAGLLDSFIGVLPTPADRVQTLIAKVESLGAAAPAAALDTVLCELRTALVAKYSRYVHIHLNSFV